MTSLLARTCSTRSIISYCYYRFGVSWIFIIGISICIGLYRRHRLRQMQINGRNNAATTAIHVQAQMNMQQQPGGKCVQV